MSSEPLLRDSCRHDTPASDLSPEIAAQEQGREEFLIPQLSVKIKGSHEDSQFLVKQGIWIKRWGRRRVIDPFIVILKRGLEPKLLSFSVALGLTFGLFPLYGGALLLCAISAMVLQSDCHVPTLMLANLVASPLQLGMVIPFMRVGELITRGEHFAFSPGGLWEAIKGHQSRDLILGALHAAIGWSVFAPVFVGFIYVASLPVFHILVRRFSANPAIHEHLLGNKDQIIQEENNDNSTA